MGVCPGPTRICTAPILLTEAAISSSGMLTRYLTAMVGTGPKARIAFSTISSQGFASGSSGS